MVCDKVVCEIWCERWCVTNLCVKESYVCERWCVKDGVGDTVVCERELCV